MYPMGVPTRIGILVPATNTAAEAGFHRACPRDVTIHSQRLWLADHGNSQAAMDRMNSELEQGARYLGQAKVKAVAMVGTTNSFYKGISWSHQMEAIMSKGAGGVPGVASSPSIAQALRYFGASKISVATPYPQWNNNRLRVYFEEAGFQVLNVEGEPWASTATEQGINDQDPAVIADFAARICLPEAEALFCSCSGWRAMEAAQELEARLGIPVITTVQATFWRTMRKAGVTTPVAGFGRLLEEMPPAEDE